MTCGGLTHHLMHINGIKVSMRDDIIYSGTKIVSGQFLTSQMVPPVPSCCRSTEFDEIYLKHLSTLMSLREEKEKIVGRGLDGGGGGRVAGNGC